MKKYLTSLISALVLLFVLLPSVTPAQTVTRVTDGVFSILDKNIAYYDYYITIKNAAVGSAVTTYTAPFSRQGYSTSHTHWFQFDNTADSVKVLIRKQYTGITDSGYVMLDTLVAQNDSRDSLFKVADTFAEQALNYRYEIITMAGSSVNTPTRVRIRTVLWKQD